MICDRCGKETLGSTGSYFNTDQICFTCRDIETKHPLFEHARQVEMEEVKRGNYNYRGVGLPPELSGRRS